MDQNLKVDVSTVSAFPEHHDPLQDRTNKLQPGMLLLDYFAAQYLHGAIAYGGSRSRPQELAGEAYDAALAMMNARQTLLKEIF